MDHSPPTKAPLEIVKSRQFRKGYKRAIGNDASKEADLREVLESLVRRIPLDQSKKDHPLKGRLKGFRDCHVRPDLVLVYRVEDDTFLRLHRIGSHSELGF
ncbi:MAG TPA: type II toxin-antitoxin system YafQ family toxin [Bdellovibrionota bacterium]|nr:type II toxin-antitoxin system YafQ family toxin [Bdellovibrionota bacterium]